MKENLTNLSAFSASRTWRLPFLEERRGNERFLQPFSVKQLPATLFQRVACPRHNHKITEDLDQGESLTGLPELYTGSSDQG
jgi:hypothetical protein